MRVLYVEDNLQDAALTQQTLLKSAPYMDLVCVPSIKAGQAALVAEKFDLVLTDYKLPDGTGMDLLAQIRDQKMPLAVVLITGMDDETIALTALKTGADDYVVKTGDYLLHLPEVLQEALQRYQNQTALRTHRIRVLFVTNNQEEFTLTRDTLTRLAPHIILSVVANPAEVFQELRQSQGRDYDLLLLEDWLPEKNALEILKELHQVHKLDIPLILEIGSGEIDLAIQALKLGAADYLVKEGAYLERLPIVLEKAYYHAQMYREQESLRKSEERYREMADLLPQVVFEVNLEANITFVNRTGLEMFGYTGENLQQGLDLFQMIHPDDHLRAKQIITEKLQNVSGDSSNEYIAVRKDGSEFPVLISSTPIVQQGEIVGLRGVLVDITDIKRRMREIRAVAEVSSALRTAQTRVEMLPVLLDQAMELVSAEAAAIGFRDLSNGDGVFAQGRGTWAGVAGRRVPSGQGISGHVLQTGESYITTDLASDPLVFTRDLIGDLTTVATVALATREHIIGWMSVGLRSRITDDDVQVLEAIADIAANALHRTSLYEQTVRQLQYLNSLRTIDLAISGSFDLQVTLEILLNQLVAQLGVDAADILLFNPYTHVLEYAAGRGFVGKMISRTRVRLGEGYAGKVALERKLLCIPSDSYPEFSSAFGEIAAQEGFVTYFAVPLVAKGNIKGVLEAYTRHPIDPNLDWLDFLDTLARQAAIAIDNSELFENLERSNADLAVAYDSTLEGWSYALDLRDNTTDSHTKMVVDLTLKVARLMQVPEKELVHIRRGALLHDIGKLALSDAILLKPGPLSDEEWVEMRKHPTYAYQMLSPISYLGTALDIPYCHHEKWDGTGYPRKLKGTEIPLSARIFAVVDVWDALRTDKPYRPRWSDQEALDIIRSLTGTHFDPKVVEVFLQLI